MIAIARRFDDHRGLCPGAMVGGNQNPPVGDRTDQSREHEHARQAGEDRRPTRPRGSMSQGWRTEQRRGHLRIEHVVCRDRILRPPTAIVLRRRHIVRFTGRDRGRIVQARIGDNFPRHIVGRRRGTRQQRDQPADPSVARANQLMERRPVERRSGRGTGGSKQQFRKLPTFRGRQRLELHPVRDQISHIGMSRFRCPVRERWIADKQELRNRLDAETDQQAQIGKHLRMHELRVIHDDHAPPTGRSVRGHDVEQPLRIVGVDRVFRLAKELGGEGAQADRATLAPADIQRGHGACREQLPNGGRHRGLADTRKTGQGHEGGPPRQRVHQLRQHFVPRHHDEPGRVSGVACRRRFDFGSRHGEASRSQVDATVGGFSHNE